MTRMTVPCDGCGQPATISRRGCLCDVCDITDIVANAAPTLTTDQLRDLRARVLALLPDTEAQP